MSKMSRPRPPYSAETKAAQRKFHSKAGRGYHRSSPSQVLLKAFAQLGRVLVRHEARETKISKDYSEARGAYFKLKRVDEKTEAFKQYRRDQSAWQRAHRRRRLWGRRPRRS